VALCISLSLAPHGERRVGALFQAQRLSDAQALIVRELPRRGCTDFCKRIAPGDALSKCVGAQGCGGAGADSPFPRADAQIMHFGTSLAINFAA